MKQERQRDGLPDADLLDGPAEFLPGPASRTFVAAGVKVVMRVAPSADGAAMPHTANLDDVDGSAKGNPVAAALVQRLALTLPCHGTRRQENHHSFNSSLRSFASEVDASRGCSHDDAIGEMTDFLDQNHRRNLRIVLDDPAPVGSWCDGPLTDCTPSSNDSMPLSPFCRHHIGERADGLDRAAFARVSSIRSERPLPIGAPEHGRCGAAA